MKLEKKIGVVIGASKDAVHTIKKAKEAGVYIFALDGNPEADGFAYADEKVVVDISKQEEVSKKVAEIQPDFIIPVPIGRYLSTTGYINDKFHLKGATYKATELSTDKYLFHQTLQENNLRNVQLYLINNDTSIYEVNIPYPAILKPRFGSGSRDVFYITNDKELSDVIHAVSINSEDFVLEEAVQGEEYGVDGAVIGGELKLILIRKKMITPLPIRQAIASFSIPKKGENNQRLWKTVEEHLKQVVKALKYDDCLINADIIVNNDGIFVIEIAPRPSGHNLHNVFVPLSTGIDMAEEYIKFLSEKFYKFETEDVRCMQIRFFDFENVIINKIPQIDELKQNPDCNIVIWNCSITKGEKMNKVTNGHSIMGRGFFIVEGKDEEDLIRQSEWILNQFEVEEI